MGGYQQIDFKEMAEECYNNIGKKLKEIIKGYLLPLLDAASFI